MGCREVVVWDVTVKDVGEDEGGRAIADGDNVDAGRTSLASYIKQGTLSSQLCPTISKVKNWMAVDAGQVLVFKLTNEVSVTMLSIRQSQDFVTYIVQCLTFSELAIDTGASRSWRVGPDSALLRPDRRFKRGREV